MFPVREILVATRAHFEMIRNTWHGNAF
jgi:hypothetical protein